ncbi:unnamed protein product [Parnassius apollo]|uniref:(apollo) hypothetical protein n=1 Tax=Parnassius apollo TaxID=110799 RepID=A0A8S3Y0L5_PARAO|nr:unnamed protein product [Parnassius apollo]
MIGKDFTMWPKISIILAFIGIVISEVTVPGIDRTMSEGVRSLGYKIVYGDEDMMEINEVIKDTEKFDGLKSKINLNEAMPPLPAQDVKCLMSTDNHCTKDMYVIKGVLIQAMKNDCAKCSAEEKENAGKVVASMMAHDPVAWKMFLSRCALLMKPQKSFQRQEKIRLKKIGRPQEIHDSNNRYLLPGAKVRVKRYQTEKL